MSHMWDKIVKWLCAAGGAVAGLLGEWDVTLTVLSVMMCVDYLSGVIVAACGRSPKTETGGLNSKVGFVGLAKKGFIMLMVLVAALLDRVIGTDGTMFRSMAVGYYIANEGLSVLENAALLGVPFPAKMRKALEILRDKGDKDDEE
jgi:toxin secretion/phage lysis holin